MRTTRQSILQIIQRQRTETVGGLAKELDLAPATVRRHLDILQRDGLVEFSEVRKGAGRPEHSFSLTDRGHEMQPKGYDSLLLALVIELSRTNADQMSGKTGAEALQAALTRLGLEVAREYAESASKSVVDEAAGQSATGQPATDPRVAAAVRALQDRDFGPEVRHGPQGATIVLSNCPFRSVAMADDAICSYDMTILQAILGTPVRRDRCISRGHDCCEYFAPAGPVAMDGEPQGN